MASRIATDLRPSSPSTSGLAAGLDRLDEVGDLPGVVVRLGRPLELVVGRPALVVARRVCAGHEPARPVDVLAARDVLGQRARSATSSWPGIVQTWL